MTYLMNVHTGSVDAAENWDSEGYNADNTDLIEVVEVNSEWIEVE